MKKKATIDKGRRAAERFVPFYFMNLTRDELIDYCSVMWARGYAAGRRKGGERKSLAEWSRLEDRRAQRR
jgi:hypothetical protein